MGKETEGKEKGLDNLPLENVFLCMRDEENTVHGEKAVFADWNKKHLRKKEKGNDSR